MVSKESDRVIGALEVMMPMIQGMNNGKKFTIVYVIVPFHWGEHLGEVCTGVKITVIVLLHENPLLARREASVMTMKG